MTNNLQHKLKETDILYFLHIPKTAGTSLIRILDNHFDHNSILPQQKWDDLLQNMPKDFSKIRLVRGHYGYGIHRVLPKKPIYITMLREPTSWIISWYEHLMGAVSNKNPRIMKFFSGDESLIDVLQNTETKSIFLNPQSRYIALDYDILSLVDYFDKQNSSHFEALQNKTNKILNVKKNDFGQNPHLMKIISSLEGKILDDFIQFKRPDFFFSHITDNILLETAKQRLSEFAFFGLTERFEESMMLLCYTFGWKPLPTIPRENIGQQNLKIEELQGDVLEEIKKCTEIDSQLYQYAQNLFDKRFSQRHDSNHLT